MSADTKCWWCKKYQNDMNNIVDGFKNASTVTSFEVDGDSDDDDDDGGYDFAPAA